MLLRYFKYSKINIDDELNKIGNNNVAAIMLEPNNKICLFVLGMLFANGVRIQILNEKDLSLEGTKSFSRMAYVWSKGRGFNGEPVQLKKIENDPVDKKIFLICPVRNATPEQRKWIEDFTKEKQESGYRIHAPHLHTNQNDPYGGGYFICKQNAEAIASSEEIDIYYDQSSTGSVFDLGVAYALHKPLKLLNKEEIEFKDEDKIDKIISNWPYNDKPMAKVLHDEK